MTSSRRFRIVVCSVAALAFAGCQALHSDIAVVKDGVLPDYKATTVGRALEGTFQNAKWTSFETEKKEVVVEFNGTIQWKVLMHHFASFVPFTGDENRAVPVKFQFILSADKKTFETGHIDAGVFGGADQDHILAFVYQ